MKKKKEIETSKCVILTFAAQQYGLTVEDLIDRNKNIKKENIIISKSLQEDAELMAL